MEAIQGELFPSTGTCMVMGTASTMAAMTEALGMTLPGHGGDPGAPRAATPARGGRRPPDRRDGARGSPPLADPHAGPAFENAMRLLMAVGGSTNAVVHLPAIAGRAGVALDLDDFDRFARTTPMVASVRPSGKYHMEDLAEAGGIPAVLKALAPLLHLDALTVTGQTLGAILEATPAPGAWQEVIAPLDRPFKREGGLAILRGSLAPDGAVLKVSAATPALLRHRGRACVFRDLADLAARIDDPALPVTPDSVLVLQNAGPVGGPGMPEAGSLPIPRKLLAAGVRDMVRVSDARMSGTAGGTVVLHVAPEAAVGGPLALVRDGDEILLDTEARRLDLLVADEELGAPAGGVDAAGPAAGPRLPAALRRAGPAGARGLRLRLPGRGRRRSRGRTRVDVPPPVASACRAGASRYQHDHDLHPRAQPGPRPPCGARRPGCSPRDPARCASTRPRRGRPSSQCCVSRARQIPPTGPKGPNRKGRRRAREAGSRVG